jgi:hypothetical protein
MRRLFLFGYIWEVKTITLIILLLYSGFSFSQSPNFFVDGARWVYYTWESYEPGMSSLEVDSEQNVINGDTLINLISYKKLYTTRKIVVTAPPFSANQYISYDSIGPQYIRYDSSSKKVYFRTDTSATDILIYDFNLSVGDTVPMISDLTGYAIIDSIRTISFFGYSSHKYYLPYYNSWDSLNYIIEGIGGSNGLTYFQPVVFVISGGIYMTSLTCFQLGDSIYSPSGGGCPFITGILKEENKLMIGMYPNPTSSNSEITFTYPSPGSATEIVINNIDGKEVGRYTLPLWSSVHKVKLPEMSRGVYVARLLGERVAANVKFVVE